MSLAILELLKEKGIKAEVSCGLSLGEYTALIYSKALTFEQGVKLVQKRGEYMQSLVPSGNWAMAAVLGMDEDEVNAIGHRLVHGGEKITQSVVIDDNVVEVLKECTDLAPLHNPAGIMGIEACKKVDNGFVVPVNFNTTGQIVVSGEKEAVEKLEIIAKEMGAKKVRMLNTSGPFHTEKLINASDKLREELDKITFNDFETDVVKNIDGLVYSKQDDIKDILAKHIVSPVRFSKCLQTMLDLGVDTFIEVGPR